MNILDALKQDSLYTLEDIYALPAPTRAELIDGQIYYMALPSTNHQRLLNYICTEINLYIRENNGQCEVFPAPFAVFLNKDNINYVEPDLSVVCSKDKLDEKGCNGAPDWIIEIVSPGSKSRDYMAKLFKYRTANVREYWIVDPEKQMITVYAFEKDEVEQYSFTEEVPSRIFSGFSLKMVRD